MIETLLRVPASAWRALATATWVAGVLAVSVHNSTLDPRSLVQACMVVALVGFCSYWFVRVAFGFFLGLLSVFFERLERAFLFAAVVANAAGCLTLLLSVPGSHLKPEALAEVAAMPAGMLGALHLLRRAHSEWASAA